LVALRKIQDLLPPGATKLNKFGVMMGSQNDGACAYWGNGVNGTYLRIKIQLRAYYIDIFISKESNCIGFMKKALTISM